MYARFTVGNNSSTEGYGGVGFVNAITALATATSGSAPAKPTGVLKWDVIGTEEAGGWTVVSSNSVGNQYNWNIEIEANTAVSGKKKRWKAQSGTTNTTNRNNILVYFSFVDNGSLLVNQQDATDYNTANTTGDYQGFLQKNIPNGYVGNPDLVWHVSVTESYFYLWYDYTAGLQFSNWTGVADIQGIPDSVIDGKWPAFPAVAHFSANANGTYFMNSSTSQYFHEYFGTYVPYYYAGSYYAPSYAEDYIEMQNENYVSVNDNNPFTRVGPFWSWSNGNQDAAQSARQAPFVGGQYLPTIYPTEFVQRPVGIMNGRIAGAGYFYFGLFRSSQAIDTMDRYRYENTLVYDENGDRWTVHRFNSNKSNNFLKAFRAV